MTTSTGPPDLRGAVAARLAVAPARVSIATYATDGWSSSDSRFDAVSVQHDDGERRYVLKTTSWQTDWTMRATGDALGRAVRLWQHGVLARLPDEVEHATVAAWADPDGRQFLLMHDARSELLPEGIIPEATEELILDALAAIHARFLGDPSLDDPRLGLCTPTDLYRVFSPAGARAAAGPRPPRAVRMILEGWELLDIVLDPDVRTALRSLVHDPSPLATGLAQFPRTLVHDDFRMANLGVVPRSGRLLVLDWARAAAAPPAVDLAWHLAIERLGLPWSRERVIATYEARLRHHLRVDRLPAWWDHQLRLALLGGVMQFGPFQAAIAREAILGGDPCFDVDDLAGWWSDRIREALPLLPGERSTRSRGP